MQRVMIIGQPGSGKSTLARDMGEITGLPVVYIDHIHWQSGWVERSNAEKDTLCAEVHAQDRWIFEGGRSATWPERLARSDTVIWLDFPLLVRSWRVLYRTVRYWRQTRPDLPEGCPEQFSSAFWRWVWDTRHTARATMQSFYNSVPPEKCRVKLTNPQEVDGYLARLKGIPTMGFAGMEQDGN